MELILLWSSVHFSVALHDRVLLECGTEQCGVGGVISCYAALMSSAVWCSPKLRKYSLVVKDMLVTVCYGVYEPLLKFLLLSKKLT
jgi:hypothetical protein